MHWGADFLLLPFDSPLKTILCLRAVNLPQVVADGPLTLTTGCQDLKGHALQICLEGSAVVALLPGHLKHVTFLAVCHTDLQHSANATQSCLYHQMCLYVESTVTDFLATTLHSLHIHLGHTACLAHLQADQPRQHKHSQRNCMSKYDKHVLPLRMCCCTGPRGVTSRTVRRPMSASHKQLNSELAAGQESDIAHKFICMLSHGLSVYSCNTRQLQRS